MDSLVEDPESTASNFAYYEKLEDFKKEIKTHTDKVDKGQRSSSEYFNGLINEMINQQISLNLTNNNTSNTS